MNMIYVGTITNIFVESIMLTLISLKFNLDNFLLDASSIINDWYKIEGWGWTFLCIIIFKHFTAWVFFVVVVAYKALG